MRLALLLSLALGACASAPPLDLYGEAPRDYTPEDYRRVYQRWTRDAEAFAWTELQDVLRVTATFEARDFRWAYVVRYANDHSLVPDQRDALLRATLADAAENHRFFVTLAGQYHREGNLAAATTAWRVLLVDPEGGQTAPVEVERLRRPTAAERVYFPSVGPWRQAFRIVFPAVRADGSPSIPTDAGFVLLRLTGARGRVDLRWDLAGSSPDASGNAAAGRARPSRS
ncbi:MAG: hypothetical protein AAGH15_21385 [Myxococcota bacterium]